MIKDVYGVKIDVGDFIVYTRPGGWVPDMAKVVSFTKGNNPRVILGIGDKPKALLYRRGRSVRLSTGHTAIQYSSTKIQYIKIKPTDEALNSFNTQSVW